MPNAKKTASQQVADAFRRVFRVCSVLGGWLAVFGLLFFLAWSLAHYLQHGIWHLHSVAEITGWQVPATALIGLNNIAAWCLGQWMGFALAAVGGAVFLFFGTLSQDRGYRRP